MIKNVPTGLAHVAIPAGDFTTTVQFYKNLERIEFAQISD